MSRPVLRPSLCDFLGIEYPIVLAGMGSRGLATPSRLVAAVSNAGGLERKPAARIMADLVRETIEVLEGLPRVVTFAR